MKTIKIITLLFIANLLFTSCATIFTGTKQKVTFKSNVEGKVMCNLTEIGSTNQEIKVYRRDMEKLFTIKADGCTDKQMELPLKTNPAFFVNFPFILTGVGLLGSYWDVIHHSNLKTDKVIEVTVECKGKK
jgi:hypothetical protein